MILFLLSLSLLFTNNELNSYKELIRIYKKTSLDTSLIDTNKIIKNANELVYIRNDIYGRKSMMSKTSSYYWTLLDSAAKAHNIKLLIVSAYRSYSYQANIIKRKMKSGMSLENILKENTLPGYSEHHSGSAIDLTNNEIRTLSMDFKETKEYKWLSNNAYLYNFYLSYPENQSNEINFEPWHWSYKEKN